MKHILALLLSFSCVTIIYAEQRQQVGTSVGWEWIKHDDNAEYWFLYVHGERKGAYWPNAPQDANYLPIVGGNWAQHKIRCPWQPPRQLIQPNANSGIPLGGVDPSKIHADRVTVNGMERSNAISYQQMPNDAGLTDDSWKNHVTFICDDEAIRKAVQQQWESDPAFKELREKCHFLALPITTPKGQNIHSRLYRTDIDKRFQQQKCAFYVQPPAGPDGKSEPRVVYGYNAQQLPNQLTEAVREVDPTFDPNRLKTPGGGNLGIKTWVFEKFAQLKTWVMANIEIVVIVGGLIWFFNRKSK